MTTIAPPREHFELGQPVTFHHRAGIARIPNWERERINIVNRCWIMTKEGTDGWWPHGSPCDKMRVRDDINKTVVCWPEDGSGIVIGMVRRGIGRSHAGYESGYEIPEWEPGYFHAKEWVWLYAVKGTLNGVRYALVPMWAAQASP